ncbi:hypothetical protein L596_000559 [Steinernema carpocapsae]|uniref:Uncharacterized protein n=1 Tax=Steinernema carpocapsae TaxID=34508 RepID=A0A4U8UKV4_STECR|nr:hypothetical protein L596_000559 [Steinernema carpocapsae]
MRGTRILLWGNNLLEQYVREIMSFFKRKICILVKLFHDQYSQVMASENGTLILNMALQYLESATSNLPPPPTVH